MSTQFNVRQVSRTRLLAAAVLAAALLMTLAWAVARPSAAHAACYSVFVDGFDTGQVVCDDGGLGGGGGGDGGFRPRIQLETLRNAGYDCSQQSDGRGWCRNRGEEWWCGREMDWFTPVWWCEPQ